jgi:hypothetical protein
MKKIPTLFKRNPEDMKHVLPEVTPGCEWVLAGEGTPTRKYDGTCVLVRDGAMFARREVKPGKTPPVDFELVETDPNTGKSVGWVPVTDAPEWKRHWEAWDLHATHPLTIARTQEQIEAGVYPPADTYELVGPKVNGNPEAVPSHRLVPHGYLAASEWDEFRDAPRDFDGLGEWLTSRSYEGIVWHHPDGRMAKLKRRDFE